MFYSEITRKELLTCLPKGGKICEVGVFKGEFSREIINILEPLELHLIDIWKWTYFDWDSPLVKNKLQKDHFIHWAKSQFAEYKGDHPDHLLERFYQEILILKETTKNTKIKVYRGDRLAMADQIPDQLFDAIYIDADHHYDSVLEDLFYYRKKLKKGGIIIGDDFIDDLKRSDGLYGTIDAVNTFIKRSQMKPLLITGFGESQYVLYEENSSYVKEFTIRLLTKGKSLIEINDSFLPRFSNKTFEIDNFKKNIPSFL